jgi:hypothetical protein
MYIELSVAKLKNKNLKTNYRCLLLTDTFILKSTVLVATRIKDM